MAPGELADVDEPVHSIQVDKGPEIDDVRDLPLDDVARVEPVEDLLALLLSLVLEHGSAREHDIVAGAIELDHLRGQFLAEELVEVLDTTDVNQACGQEAADAQVEDQTALDDLDHLAGDGVAGLGRTLDLLPRKLESRALLREDQPAFGVLLREDERVDFLVDVDLVRRVDRAADRELGDRDYPLRLVADVDKHLVLVDADDRAVHDLALVDRREGGVVIRDKLALGAARPERVVVELLRRCLRLRGALGRPCFGIDSLVRQSGGQYSPGLFTAWDAGSVAMALRKPGLAGRPGKARRPSRRRRERPSRFSPFRPGSPHR